MGSENGGPAFPIPQIDNGPGNIKERHKPGMSLRDYFAAAALTGIVACFRDHEGCDSTRTRVAKAYEYADHMLAERAKSQSGD